MSSLTDRPNTALLVIDMQKGVLTAAHEVPRVVRNINTLIDKARTEGVPVVWVQHSDDELPAGTEEWEFVPELRPADGEPLVHKHFNDSFEDTDLESVLEGLGVGRVVVTGAQTDACVRATLHGAFVRGYDTTLVGDAHTTEDLRPWGGTVSPAQAIDYTNMYWSWSKAPGRTGGTAATEEVDFGPR